MALLQKKYLLNFLLFLISFSCVHISAAVVKETENSCDENCGEETTKGTTSPSEKFLCPEFFGDFPHPEDCTKYYSCAHFIETLKTCPEGKLFDGVKKSCKSERKVHCGSRWKPSNKFQCPEYYGDFPHPRDCTKYYTCSHYSETLKTCSKGKFFDDVKKTCKSEYKVNCGSRWKPTKNFTCPEIYGDFPHPENCSKYYSCRKNIPTAKTCPENKLFDGVKISCQPEAEVNCGSKWKPTKKFQCPDCYGDFPHPENCTKYYSCSNYKETLKTCPEGKLFDGVKKSCKSACDVNCGSRWKPAYKFVCPEFYGDFPHPGDCTKYYSCAHFIETLKTCPEGKLFDSVKKSCQPEDQVNCESRAKPTNKFHCPECFGNFLHPRNCTKYYSCSNFVETLKTCPEGNVFDGVKKLCKAEHKVNCGSRWRPTTKFTCPENYGYFLHPGDCAKYYSCRRNIPTLKTCPENKLFDSKKISCHPEGEVNCGSRWKRTKKFMCPECYGDFPHPENCNKYYSCANFIETVKTCPEGRLFDGAKDSCVPEEQVNCGSRRRPTSMKGNLKLN